MIDYVGAVRRSFGRLATSIMFNPAKSAVVALNTNNATGKQLSVSVPIAPANTFGPRVTEAMLSMRQQLADSEKT